jgi:hypothetical protein
LISNALKRKTLIVEGAGIAEDVETAGIVETDPLVEDAGVTAVHAVLAPTADPVRQVEAVSTSLMPAPFPLFKE